MATFEDIFAAHHPAALRLAYLLTDDRASAEDVTADVFAKLYRRGTDDIVDPAAYIRRAIVNRTNSMWRRLRTERRTLPLFQVPTDHVTDDIAPAVVESATRTDQVMAALATLPPRQRTVLVLRYYEDRSEAEIADILGISPGSVKSSASRGMATLRSRMTTTPQLLAA